MSKLILTLFLAGQSARARMTIQNLRQICERRMGGHYELEVVDVLEDPARAAREKIIATPTLLKRHPEPVLRIIGDLSEIQRVLVGLNIHPPPQLSTDDAKGEE